MPSEHIQSHSHSHSQSQSQSQSQTTRPALGGHRSSNSIHDFTDSPAASPPQHGKSKTQKHVVHGGGRVHTRVPSGKALHKLTKAHGNEGSHTDLKKLGKNQNQNNSSSTNLKKNNQNSSSSTNLKKNSSHVSLKRNRSSADVPKRPKSSAGDGAKRPTSVHFEIGDQDDAWEEASSSASPALSRAPSRSGHSSSSKPNSAQTSRPQSPLVQEQSHSTLSNVTATANGAAATAQRPADAKLITARLLNRTPSLNTTTTKMSPILATPATSNSTSHSPPTDPSTSNSTKENLSSRFVNASLTPTSTITSSFPSTSTSTNPKRALSLTNLRRPSSSSSDTSISTSALKPHSTSHSRKPSSSTTTYNPPPQSRTQQKLWLQRSEPQNQVPLYAHDGRDPRIKLQLERTGLEYLVVRRHQDPVGIAGRRLEKMGGRRIEGRKRVGNGNGNAVMVGSVGSERDREEEGVGALLRGMWEEKYEMSGSAD